MRDLARRGRVLWGACTLVLAAAACSHEREATQTDDASGQSRETAASRSGEGEALAFEPATLDLGSVQRGAIARAAVALVNHSDQACRIERVSTSCGCTLVTDAPKELAPGERSTITVELRSSARAGTARSTTVTVLQADTQKPPCVLTVRARMVDVISFEVERDAEARPSRLVLRSLDERAFAILKADPPFVSLNASPGAASAHTLELNRAVGRLHLLLDHPDLADLCIPLDPRPATARMSASSRAGGALQVRPRRIDCGTLTIGQASTVELVLRGASDATAAIDVTCDSQIVNVSVASVESVPGGIAVQLALIPTGLGRLNDRVSIRRAGQSASVAITGLIALPPKNGATGATGLGT